MQTYSHFLITAVLRSRIQRSQTVAPGKAFLLGSVLPDVPLFLLTVGFIIARQLNAGANDEFLFGPTYDALYFTNPWWITGHNLFHGPLLILLYAAVGYALTRQTARPAWQKWGWSLLWLTLGCGLHSFVDILTHVEDGPLLFFPLNWTIRFHAPVSYWDPAHGGLIFSPIEHLLDLALLGYLGWQWRLARRQQQAVGG